MAPHHASTIVTGGLVPAGADAVLRKESGRIDEAAAGGAVLTLNTDAKPGEPSPGQHIRYAGEEAAAGDVLMPARTLLNPAHVALAAVAGHDELHVYARPLVTVLLTGAEVVTSGVPAPGQVRDTFGPQLGTVIGQLGGVAGTQQRIGDSYDEWVAALGDPGTRTGRRPDVVMTTGGTGPSGTDHFRRAVAALGGRLLLDGIAMRPGHPAVLAELPDGRFVVGLPGNPLAAMMAFLTVGEPLLAALGNRPMQAPGQVVSGSSIVADPGRTRLMPFRLVDGVAFPVPHTGPGMMRGLAWADGVLVVPPDGVQIGAAVPALALPWQKLPANKL